jgi:hypothetical protein
MSDTQARHTHPAGESTAPARPARPKPTGWVGFLYFAGVMLMMLGGFQLTEGLVAVFRDEYYVVTRGGLLLTMDYTAWGWTHVAIGVIQIGTGVGIFLGQMWARVVGIIIAVLSALANMAFLPAYPIWCTLIIAMDILVIYALTVHGREPKYT